MVTTYAQMKMVRDVEGHLMISAELARRAGDIQACSTYQYAAGYLSTVYDNNKLMSKLDAQNMLLNLISALMRPGRDRSVGAMNIIIDMVRLMIIETAE